LLSDFKSTEYKRFTQRLTGQNDEEGTNVDNSDDDSESDAARLVDLPDTNSLNSSLRATYLKSSSSTPSSSADPNSPLAASKTPLSNLGASQRSTPSQQRSKKRSRDEVMPGPHGSGNSRQPGGLGSNLDDDGIDRTKRGRPTVRYSDLGGIEGILQDVREIIERPLTHPEIFEWLGTQMPRGVLLHGPPGCGKTQLATAIAGELGVSFLQISAPEVVSGMSGESEAKIRQLFQDAKARAPAIIFIDEIDAITPKRETAAREMERRIVAQLLTCMDELEGGVPVMVIGATNRPDALDQALRRSGRFDREICLNVPDQPARSRILKVISSKLRMSGDFDFDLIAQLTPGYVGADLTAIAKEAASIAVNRIFSSLESFGVKPLETSIPQLSDAQLSKSPSSFSHEVLGEQVDSNTFNTTLASSSMEVDSELVQENGDTNEMVQSIVSTSVVVNDHHHLDSRTQVSNYLRTNTDPFTPEQLAPLSITMDDFLEAIKRVQPSAKREGFATIPNVTWEDIGALTVIRKELEMALLEPIRSKSIYEALNIPVSLGVLLYGPPGCGKTLLAKAVANQAQANFISIKGPELLNKFVGESERAVRVVFQRARASSPCIIFFDEIDALVPKRVGGENAVTERVVNQLLIELDGLEQRHGISVVAATNRPDIIDPAMLRPGRLDKLLYVPLPTPEERIHILQTCARKTPLSADVNLENIAKNSKLTGFSGADIASLVREASMIALATVLDAQNPPSTTSSKNAPFGSGNFKPATKVPVVTDSDFQRAMIKVVPSVSKADQIRYERLRNKLSSPHLIVDKDEEPSNSETVKTS
jgi:ribosome biogenesis ATPase